MDFSVEQGYRDLRILAGNEEPVCQFKLSHQGVHLLLQKQARPGVPPKLRHFQGEHFAPVQSIQARLRGLI